MGRAWLDNSLLASSEYCSRSQQFVECSRKACPLRCRNSWRSRYLESSTRKHPGSNTSSSQRLTSVSLRQPIHKSKPTAKFHSQHKHCSYRQPAHQDEHPTLQPTRLIPQHPYCNHQPTSTSPTTKCRLVIPPSPPFAAFPTDTKNPDTNTALELQPLISSPTATSAW